MAHVLGIDLGGTKVLAGVVDTASGKVLGSAKKRTHVDHGPDDIIKRMIEAATEAIDASGVKRAGLALCGIGAAGQIDRKNGVIVKAPNLTGMAGVKLAEVIQDQLGMPVRLFNDVEAAAAGEAAFGAGKGHRDFVVVFVGTGIGGAIYRGGKPYVGTNSTAGELGHMVVDVNGRLCGCGGFGHLEAYASRTAIVRAILNSMKAGRQSALSDVALSTDPSDPAASGIRSRALAEALAQGDDLVRESILSAAEYLAAGLASVINFYNPPVIVLGGGLVEAVDTFFSVASTRARQLALPLPGRQVTIIKTGLGDDAGIVGASSLAEG